MQHPQEVSGTEAKSGTAGKTIAVEEGLKPVRLALEREGYRVIGTGAEEWKDADAVVLSGGSEDMLGYQSPGTRAVVITANGRTPEEILKELKRRLP